jgi:DNA-binding PadR family transcriptional regulator
MNKLEEAVLVAISENVNTPEKLSKYLRVHKHSIEKALENLELKGLVVKEVRKFLFLKKVEYKLTEKGFEESMKIREKMRKIAIEMKEAYESGNRTLLNRLYADYRDFIPLMLAFGLVDAMWLGLLMHDFDYDAFDTPDDFMDDFDLGEIDF